MTAEQAIAAALRYGQNEDAEEPRQPLDVEQVIAEWPLDRPPEERIDRLAWLVRLGGVTGYTEVTIDDQSGAVLRVRRFG